MENGDSNWSILVTLFNIPAQEGKVDELTNFLGAATGDGRALATLGQLSVGGYSTDAELHMENYDNKSLSLYMTVGAGNLTGGHPSNTLKVTVFYMIFDL